MNWLYRTVLFEFQKDGLLGDRYIDDDEMEKVLNEFGGNGWELVSVTPVQEGLLAFFKRPLPPVTKQPVIKPAVSAESPARNAAAPGKPMSTKLPSVEKTAATMPTKKNEKTGRQPDTVGGIKIS